MALKGSLRDFTIVQLLNLINLAKKTGVLLIDGRGEAAQVYFREGKLAYARVGTADDSLTTVLLQAKKIDANQHRTLKERAGQMSDKELGLLLINANYLSQKDILACLQTQYVGVVNKLFGWDEGIFSFENDRLLPEDKIGLRIGLENLIIEGAKHMRELSQLQDEIPSLDIALKFVERPGSNIRKLNLSADEWRVIKYISPNNTLQQIAQATSLNDLDIRRVAYSLLQAGMVEFVRPFGATLNRPMPIPALAGSSKEEQKSLVNRIIQRIRSL